MEAQLGDAFMRLASAVLDDQPLRERLSAETYRLIETGLLVLSFSTAGKSGWLSSGALAMLAAAVCAFGAFAFVESKTRAPLLPLSLFRVPNVAGANLAILCVMGASGGFFLLPNIYMQQVLIDQTVDSEGGGRFRDGEFARLDDPAAAGMLDTQPTSLDEPQHRDIDAILGQEFGCGQAICRHHSRRH